MNNEKRQADAASAVPHVMPVLALRNAVFFPQQISPLAIGRGSSIVAVEEALQGDNHVVIVAQKNSAVEQPGEADLYLVGTLAKIVKVFALADGTKNVLAQGIRRVRLLSVLQTMPSIRAVVQDLPDTPAKGEQVDAVTSKLKSLFQRAAELSPHLTEEHVSIVLNLVQPGAVADVISSLLPVPVEEKQPLLEAPGVEERLRLALLTLSKLVQQLELGNKIQSEVQEGISQSQREYYLREQLRAIRKELGEDDANVEMAELRKRIEEAGLPEEARKVADREFRRLSQMNQASAEYTVSRTYLEWILDLPWNTSTTDTLDIARAREILENDHYGLGKVKNRILEYLAVRKLKNDMRGPILVFVGPPGVGKTSLGRSIANALGRKFVRISLGGVHDEAEIRGHRRTYIGALPGRIIQGLRKAGSNNPVFMLDEIDKIGQDFRGDPASALLEVLDAEQNFAFSDHYLEVPFDLSKVMFIATANLIEPVPPPLRDRMEILEIPSYVEDEKLHIARTFLLPKQRAEHGLTENHFTIDDEAVRAVINGYTREAGVRGLERQIASLVRSAAREVAEGISASVHVRSDDLSRYLGQRKFYHDTAERINRPGIAVGLAWTPVGGDILFVEATKAKGRGGLLLTGQLGDVMKESAQAALSFIATHAQELGVPADFRSKLDLHVHVPAGAVPKDGPSAGVTMLTALTSALTGRHVRHDLAMTGEITLRGSVLPVGGIKEKVLAALRAGITTIILPERNRNDLADIPEASMGGDREVQFLFVKEMSEVLALSLLSREESEQAALQELGVSSVAMN